MVAAGRISERRLRFQGLERMSAAIAGLGLPTRVDGLERARVEDLLRHDKKRDSSGMRMVLLRALADPVVEHVEAADLDARPRRRRSLIRFIFSRGPDHTAGIMISTNDVKPGMALQLSDGLFSIVEYQHVKPGKGRAFVRMKIKNLETGQVLDRTFRADENVDQAIIERRDHQYLYRDDLGFHFMNLDDYGQLALSGDDVGGAAGYLVEGMTASLSLYRGTPIAVELPAAVELEVTYAEPAVKGDTRTGATKPVTLQTGIQIQVPLFVEQGDRVKVDTRSGEYLTRV